jgi:hypothetical protein
MRRRGGYKGGRSRQRERHGIHGWILFLPAGEGWRSVRPLFRAAADSIDNGTKGAFPRALEFGRILEWDGGSINRRRGRRGRSGESDPPRSKSNCPAVHGVRRPQCRPIGVRDGSLTQRVTSLTFLFLLLDLPSFTLG